MNQHKTLLPLIPHLQLPPGHPLPLQLTPPLPAQMSHQLLSEQGFVDSAGTQGTMPARALKNNFVQCLHVLILYHRRTHSLTKSMALNERVPNRPEQEIIAFGVSARAHILYFNELFTVASIN